MISTWELVRLGGYVYTLTHRLAAHGGLSQHLHRVLWTFRSLKTSIQRLTVEIRLVSDAAIKSQSTLSSPSSPATIRSSCVTVTLGHIANTMWSRLSG